MRSVTLFASLSFASFLLVGCSSTPLNDKPADVAAPTSDARTVSTVTTQSTVPPKADDTLAKRSIYFDYDDSLLNGAAKPVIEAHGQYLTTNKARKIVIQGNADERGGAEYNLALGQKRAEAVRKSLTLLGVAESQMEAVSFGEEKPKAAGNDETSWAENRRADIVYQ